MKKPIRILIVEDEVYWQNMITQHLKEFPDLLIIGIAENIEQGIYLGKILDYDFIIIDLQLDQTFEDGFLVLEEIKKVRGNIQAIFLTNNTSPDMMYHAFLQGGYHYIPKTYLQVLSQTIHYLYENPVSNLMLETIQDKVKEYRLADLTPTERSIFGLLKQGLKPKAIAESLTVSLYTVRSHIKNVLKKLGAKNYRDALKMLYCEKELVASRRDREGS